jgi:methylmalonyl-CoA mutase C-terminal domain/subunit
MQRKIRVLVGKPGLDGHDRGAKVVAAALRDAGMEVIYTGLHQTSDQIVEAALQEDVDVVALSILSGAHMTLFPQVLERMRETGIGDKLLTGGGIIPPEDMQTLADSGVGRLFGPGSSTQDIAEYIREWFRATTGDEPYVATAPLQPARLPGAGGPMPTPALDRHHARAAAKPAAKPAPKRAKAATARRNGKPARAGARKAAKASARPARRAAAGTRTRSAAKKVARRKPARRR